jgi:glycosyltransferase involved in cell wall biosynthesis
MMELSVIIPVYNRAKMLAQALESLRWQTHKNFVVIVCDDASTANLAEIIKGFPDLDIQYHRFDKNAGQFMNAMRGLELCQTPYMKYLYSDDLFFPTALEHQLQALKQAPNAGVCLGGTIYFEVDSDQSQTKLLHFAIPYIPKPRASNAWAELEIYSSFDPPACTYRTEIFREVGGFNTDISGIADWEIFLALSAKYPVVAVNEPVCAMRDHADQVTKQFFLNSDSLFIKDILWMTSTSNPYRDRISLPPDQIKFLRHQVCWRILRMSLKSDGFSWPLLVKWMKIVKSNQMLVALILGFPGFFATNSRRKPRGLTNGLEKLDRDHYQGMIDSILFKRQNQLIAERS